MSQLVSAYLVVYRCSFNSMIIGEIFLKSKIDPRDVYGILTKKTCQSFYDSFTFNPASKSIDDPRIQYFAKKHDFKILYIIEKKYLASYFDNDGDFVLERTLRQNFQESCPSRCNPPSLMDLTTLTCKNQLFKNRKHAFHLISIIPPSLIIRVMFCKPTFKFCNCVPMNKDCKTCVDIYLKENELRDVLKYVFIESLFETNVPRDLKLGYRYCDGNVIQSGPTGYRSYSGKYRNKTLQVPPVTREMMTSFFEIRELLAPHLDFAVVVYENLESF